MRLVKNLSIGLVSAAALAAAAPAFAQAAAPAGQTATPAPAPAPAPAATTTVAQALQASTDHTTLVKLVQAANVESELSGPGPVTIFAPDDAAFGRLGAAVQQLLDPANAGSAAQIVKYHIVQGSYPAQELLKQLKAGGGTMTLNTLDGQPLTLTLQGASSIQLTDAKGGKAFISKLSDTESNGVIEYINGVLSPTMHATVAPPPGAAGAAGAPAGDATAAPGAAPDASAPPAAGADGGAAATPQAAPGS